MYFIGAIINGLGQGAVYALIALGYTMVYGIAKMLNFAHGDVIMVGAYVIFVTAGSLAGIPGAPYFALIASMALCVVLGVTIERLAYKPLRGASSLSVLITAIGVSFMLQSLAQIIFTPTPRFVPALEKWGSVSIGPLTVKIQTIVAFAAGVIIMTLLTLFIRKSKTGRAMLAVSEDKGAARLMGINVNKTIAITFAIGSALAAVASFFMLIFSPSLDPTYGAMPGIKAFVAAVLGGIGSIPGAAVGALIIGII